MREAQRIEPCVTRITHSQVPIAASQFFLIRNLVYRRILPVLLTSINELSVHAFAQQHIVGIHVQGFVPVLIDVIRPVEFSLYRPTAVFPSQNGLLAGDDVVFEQAAIKSKPSKFATRSALEKVPVVPAPNIARSVSTARLAAASSLPVL